MKTKSLILFAVLSFTLLSCDSGLKFNNPLENSHGGNDAEIQDMDSDESADTDEPTDAEPDDTDTDDSGDSEPTDSGDSEPTDSGDSEPTDSGDSEPDEDADSSDFTDDSGDSEPTDSGDSEPTDSGDSEPTDSGDSEPDEEPITDEEPAADEEPLTRTKTCSGLPANASWHNGSSITQTFDGNDWYPPATGFYSETAVANECGFKCNQGYNWNGDWGKCFIKPAFGNICTSQTKCYNNSEEITCPASTSTDFYGQDAQYAKLGYCYPPSFSIKTNNSGENIVVDNYTGLEWQQVLSEETFTWENAITHCNNLNYGGYTDWRLPDPIELLPIVNHSKSTPAVDSAYFQISSDVWSSKSHNTTNALSFGSDFGSIWYRKEKTSPLKIMCVRGNKLTKPTFTTSTTNGDVVVKDSITGLIWQKTYVTGKTWQEALKYCEDLTYAGKSDWRVPNKNEQASLLNFEKSIPYSDFPDMPKEKAFWTNSTNAEYEHKTYAWHTNFSYGTNTDKKSISDPYFVVRCVRSEKINDPCENHICGSAAHSSGVCVPENAFEYSCACDDGYFWDGEECVNPCNANPCSNLSNSTKVCTSLSPTDYSCGCNSGYGWNGETCVKPLALGNICTGQTKCFNNEAEITCPTSASANFYGQDAQYRNKCAAQSFKEITAFGQKIVIDKNTTLQWQQTISGASYNWEDAIDYCEDLEYGGYTDWRLPSPHELLTITDISRDNPAVNTAYFKISSELWSSASYSDTNAFFLGKGAGVYYTKEKTESLPTMCVRGNELKEPTFTSSTTNSDVVIKDSATNLNWQKTYATKASWLEALKYCEGLTYAGKSDWRMPNKNELASLVNYEKTNPASDFPDITTKWFWTSSTHINNFTNTWNVAFANGSVGINASKNSSGAVRCVR